MPIIITPCSKTAHIIDATLTTLAWVAFIYLFANGVLSVVDRSHSQASLGLVAQFLPVVQTLSTYVAVAALNALLLVLWARHYKMLFSKLDRTSPLRALDTEMLAYSFQVSGQKLRQIQQSQIAIIHHTADGTITAVEIEERRLQVVAGGNE